MKVLVADDEDVTRRLLESSLQRWGYEVLSARDGLTALEILRQPDAPTLAILDWLMPGMDGAELCQEVRRLPREAYTYVVLLTSRSGKQDVVAGLDSGADDYLTKPFHPQELKVRLRTGKRILYLLGQLIATRETLRDLATHDSLTKTLTRAAILETMSEELQEGSQQEESLGVVLLDLDYFKRINDSHGHLVGDDVLRQSAEAMLGTVRPYDRIGRYGGEEFLILLPGCDRLNAVSHAERLRAAVGRVTIPTPSGEVKVAASCGVTVAGADDTDTVEVVFHTADEALYRAKQNGRNRVEFVALSELARAK